MLAINIPSTPMRDPKNKANGILIIAENIAMYNCTLILPKPFKKMANIVVNEYNNIKIAIRIDML